MRWLFLTALLTLGLDQLSKIAVIVWLDLANRGEIDVLPPWLVFRMAWNYGINFGLFAGHADLIRWVLIGIALVISVWVALWARQRPDSRPIQISAGLLIGGALGNVADRLRWGAVGDFINTSCCGFENPYAFNIADIAIFIGAIGLVIFSARPAEKPPSGRSGRKAS